VRLTVLASGSSGNALVVEADGTSLLLDCGISCRQVVRRMRQAALDPSRLSAVLLTHEHSDHVQGLEVFARRFDVAVAATTGTLQSLVAPPSAAEVLAAGREARFGALSVLPFSVSHDAREPVGFVLEDRCCRVGVLTDTGSVTAAMAERLAGCHAVLLEANHDLDMLRQGSYPWPLKQRIASATGHLSNEQSRELLDRLVHAELQAVVAMHLSRENNLPTLALRELARPLAGGGAYLAAASQEGTVQIDVPGRGGA
jgi:phosphoribosyl 1,2-cyclic phosphodiesterase